MTAILVVQVSTFIALGGAFFAAGQWKLGASQILLAGVQALIYS